MPLSPINLLLQDAYTKDGRKYKKSNIAKTVFTTTIIAVSLKDALKNSFEPKTASKVFKSVYNSKTMPKISKDISKTVTKYTKNLSKQKIFGLYAILGTLIALGLGTAIDSTANYLTKSSFNGEFKGRADKHCNAKCKMHQG